MTKQITIKEDGVSKSESVDFINTQVAGGSADWMPEDEATVGTLLVTSNGEYVPSDYGLYGFFSVGVLVPGGNGAVISPTSGYVTPLPATGLGASVIGIDPTDGAMYRTEIQDVDGVPTLVKTKVADSKADYKPVAMKILIKPAKLSYKVGEKINYAGLVVQLLDSTGYTFVDERFPQGIISWSPVKNLLHPEYDLITPVENVQLSVMNLLYERYNYNGKPFYPTIDTTYNVSGRAIGITRRATLYSDKNALKEAIRAHLISFPRIRWNERYFDYDETGWLIYESDSDDVRFTVVKTKVLSTTTKYSFVQLLASYEPFTVWSVGIKYRYSGDPSEWGNVYVWKTSARRTTMNFDGSPVSVYTVTGFTTLPYINVTISDIIYGSFDGDFPYTHSSPENADFAIIGRIMLQAELEQSDGEIPVQWKSPYDNQTYEDTFEIEVTDG